MSEERKAADMGKQYEVCVTVMEPYTAEVRLPPVPYQKIAEVLAACMKVSYPNALIEIAHDGIRESR